MGGHQVGNHMNLILNRAQIVKPFLVVDSAMLLLAREALQLYGLVKTSMSESLNFKATAEVKFNCFFMHLPIVWYFGEMKQLTALQKTRVIVVYNCCCC